MKVSLNWLRQYIGIEDSAEKIAEILTSGGIEVESIENLNKGFSKVVIGQITDLQKHPNAERLQICKVNIGNEELVIVTGADNVRVEDRIPVALCGAQLPDGLKIKPSKLRGIDSFGMLCSEKELGVDSSYGLDRSKGGILILSGEPPIGMDVGEYFGLNDWIIELELYPNRPDCLAMVNVARELGTLIGKKPQLPAWASMKEAPSWAPAESPKIFIDNPELSWRYSALLVEDVCIEPSPVWMQNRLRAAGVRPINNIVDITNYCMLEMGQPLHAFDRDKLNGDIHVRTANEGEKMLSLDGVERILDSSMLVIADDKVPVAIAGVMGGLDSEVTEGTTRILFESAHFLGASIRRTSRKLGLRSESSNRFEKGVNPYGTVPTLGRVAVLLAELKAGKVIGFTETVCQLPEQYEVELTLEKTSRILGVEVSKADMENVLSALDFPFDKVKDNQYLIKIPSYRQDIKIEEDMIEEVARIIGYDKIPTTLPGGNLTQGHRTPVQVFRQKIRHLLVNLGINEVMTYSFVKKEHDIKWGKKTGSIPLLNPLRDELGVMRTSLLPGLLEIGARNVARRNLDCLIFEIGNVYLAKEYPIRELPHEVSKIAGLAVGTSSRHWLSPQVKYDFYYVKGLLDVIAENCDIQFKYQRAEDERLANLLHPGRSAEIFIGQTKVGFLGELHPLLEGEWELERPVVFELDFDVLAKHSSENIIARSYARFPAMQRDLAVVVSDEVSAEDIKHRIVEIGGELLNKVEIFDVYKGNQVAAGSKSLAFALKYQSQERTLTDEEVSKLNFVILEAIQKEFGAEWRK